MIQVRDDWVFLLVVVAGMEYGINVTAVYNIHNRIIDSGRCGVISVLNSGAGYFLIWSRRMRVLLSKELPILKDSPWFIHVPMHEVITNNASISHFSGLCKPSTPDYLLPVPIIYEIFEQTPSISDKIIKFGYDLYINFLLFALSDVLEHQISTTLITPLRQTIVVMKGLQHLLFRFWTTGNEPVVLKIGLAISICRAQGKTENEYVFVSTFMTGFACFTFGSASTSKSEYCIVRQSNHFQSEDSPCNGH